MPSHVDPAIYVTADIGDRMVTARLMRALKLRQAEAVGHLVMLWGRAALHARDGVIAGYTDVQLEAWAGWTGKRGAFAAWLRSEHMDADGRPRDWQDYAGRLAVSRTRARDKKQRQRGGLSPGHTGGHIEGQAGDNNGDGPYPVPGDVPGDSLRARSRHSRESTEYRELPQPPGEAALPPRASARETAPPPTPNALSHQDLDSDPRFAAFLQSVPQHKAVAWRAIVGQWLAGGRWGGSAKPSRDQVLDGLLAAVTATDAGPIGEALVSACIRRVMAGVAPSPPAIPLGYRGASSILSDPVPVPLAGA